MCWSTRWSCNIDSSQRWHVASGAESDSAILGSTPGTSLQWSIWASSEAYELDNDTYEPLICCSWNCGRPVHDKNFMSCQPKPRYSNTGPPRPSRRVLILNVRGLQSNCRAATASVPCPKKMQLHCRTGPPNTYNYGSFSNTLWASIQISFLSRVCCTVSGWKLSFHFIFAHLL